MKAKPYLRSDLEVVGGSVPPAREFIVTTWQNIGAPRRLLATLDAAYEEFDETRAEDAAVIAKLRSELAFKNNDLVDRLIELHQREMNDYSIRSGDLALKARSGLQSQFNVAAADLKSYRAELAGVSARIAAVRGYADKLAACDPRTKWRGTDVARHLNTILKEGTEE